MKVVGCKADIARVGIRSASDSRSSTVRLSSCRSPDRKRSRQCREVIRIGTPTFASRAAWLAIRTLSIVPAQTFRSRPPAWSSSHQSRRRANGIAIWTGDEVLSSASSWIKSAWLIERINSFSVPSQATRNSPSSNQPSAFGHIRSESSTVLQQAKNWPGLAGFTFTLDRKWWLFTDTTSDGLMLAAMSAARSSDSRYANPQRPKLRRSTCEPSRHFDCDIVRLGLRLLRIECLIRWKMRPSPTVMSGNQCKMRS